MQLEKLKEIQSFFLDTVTLSPELNIEIQFQKPQAKFLVEETFYRMNAYRTSYYSRISSVLSECLFYPASYLLGKEFVKSFLVEFFSKNTTSKDIINAARGFPYFLEQHEYISECPFVPDLMQMCIHKFDILKARDPNGALFIEKEKNIPKPKDIFLQKENKFMTSQWPIYQFWNAALELDKLQEENKEVKEFNLKEEGEKKLSQMENAPESILLIKNSCWSLECILVPQIYIPLVEKLSKGLSLEDAVEQSDIEESSFDAAHFSNWIALMTQKKALVKSIVSGQNELF